jgi:hypothetical protein
VKRGDKVTAVVNGGIARVLLLDGALSNTWNARIYRKRNRGGSIYPLKQTWTVDLSPECEDVTWARGWEGEAPDALRASRALLSCR